MELTLAEPASTFAFPAQANNTPYDVTIVDQPVIPPQRCTVRNGSGTVNGANVNNVAITCVDVFVILGSVRGLSGTGLVIRNNGMNLPIAANETTFEFLPQEDGTTY